MLPCCWLLLPLQTRVLRLQVAELERSIHALNTAMPDLPAIDRDIAALKADLLKVRPRVGYVAGRGWVWLCARAWGHVREQQHRGWGVGRNARQGS